MTDHNKVVRLQARIEELNEKNMKLRDILREGIEVMIENSEYTEVIYMLENERDFIHRAREVLND